MPTKKNFLGGNQNYNPKNGEYEPSLVGKNGKVVKDADGDGKTHEGWDFDEESKTYTSKDGEVFSEKDYKEKIGGDEDELESMVPEYNNEFGTDYKTFDEISEDHYDPMTDIFKKPTKQPRLAKELSNDKMTKGSLQDVFHQSTSAAKRKEYNKLIKNGYNEEQAIDKLANEYVNDEDDELRLNDPEKYEKKLEEYRNTIREYLGFQDEQNVKNPIVKNDKTFDPLSNENLHSLFKKGLNEDEVLDELRKQGADMSSGDLQGMVEIFAEKNYPDQTTMARILGKANKSKSKMNITAPKANVSTSSSGGAIQDILSKYQEEAFKIDPSDERALNRLKGKYEGRYEKELEAAGITDIDQLESKYHKTNEGYIDLDETGWNAKKETLKESLKDLYRESDIDDVIKMREEGYKAAQKYYGGKVPESVKGGIKEYLEKTNPGEYQTDYIKTDATVDDFAKAWNSGNFDSILIDEGGLDSAPRNVILEYVESQGYKYDPKTGDLVKTAKQKTKQMKK